MNCNHMGDGWCLDCVKKLHDNFTEANAEVARLQAQLTSLQWISINYGLPTPYDLDEHGEVMWAHNTFSWRGKLAGRNAATHWRRIDLPKAEENSNNEAQPTTMKKPIGLFPIHYELKEELRHWLKSQSINGENIGDIRRSLFVPWDSKWNGIVRDETAAREMEQPSPVEQAKEHHAKGGRVQRSSVLEGIHCWLGVTKPDWNPESNWRIHPDDLAKDVCPTCGFRKDDARWLGADKGYFQDPWHQPEQAKPNIILTHHRPPIPVRSFDWSAYRDGYDEGDLIGWGATKEEAIADLLSREGEE